MKDYEDEENENNVKIGESRMKMVDEWIGE